MSTPVFRVFIEIRGFFRDNLLDQGVQQAIAAFFCSAAIIHLAMPKYSHYRRHDCSPELFSGFFCVTSAHFWKKSVSTVSAQSAALLVAAMGVQICYHTGLRVAGIHGMADAISPPSEMGYAAANTREYTDMFRAGEVDPSAPGQAFCLGAYRKSDMLYLGLINRLDQK